MKDLSTRSKVILVLALFLLGWLLGEVFLRGDRAEIEWAWRSGDRLAYEVTYSDNGHVRGDSSRTASALKRDISGVLHVRVFEVRSSRVFLGFQFIPTRFLISGDSPPPSQSEIQTVFLGQYARTGEPLLFEFSSEMGRKEKKFLKEMLLVFQVVLPDWPTESWQIAESDKLGDYLAEYSHEGGYSASKRKLRYASLAADIKESQIGIRFDPDGYLNHMRVSETVAARLPNGSPVTHRISGEMARTDVDRFDDVALNQSRSYGQLANSFRGLAEASRKVPPDTFEKTAPEDASIEKRIRELIEKRSVQKLSESEFEEAVRNLLGENSEFQSALLSLLKDEETSDEASEIFLRLLAGDGSPSTQDTLLSVVRDSDFPQDVRLQAVDALGSVAEPTENTAAALLDVSVRTQNAFEMKMAERASESLRQVAQVFSEDFPRLFEELTVELSRRLETTADAEKRKELVTLLGSTGDPLILNVVRRLLADSDPEVRIAAGQAIGGLAMLEGQDLMIQSLSSERDERVRAALVTQLVSFPDFHEPTLRLLSAEVAREKNEASRYLMANYLATYSDEFPEARSTLERLESDPSERIRALVSETLY